MTALASKSQLRMSFVRYALITVPLVLLLGIVSGRVAGSGYGNPWFDALVKPAAMPPDWVFGLAWTLLYVLLGLAAAMILHARGAHGRGRALALFGLQLLLNFAWSPVFFGAHKVSLALSLIVAMIVITAATVALFARIRVAAAVLMLPYVAWLLFAAFLTYKVMMLNPGAESLVPHSGSPDITIEL